MKLPSYLKVEYSYKPTEFDSIGCDGIYVVSVGIKWWGWPIVVMRVIWEMLCDAIRYVRLRTLQRDI